MGKKSPDSILENFVGQCRETWGRHIVAVIVYGSAARGDYDPGRSDINTLVVLDQAGPDFLAKAMPLVANWRRWGLAMPLFVTPGDIADSLDVFPVEFLNMKAHYQLLTGDDPLAGLTFDFGDIRRECEREFRGKLITLRQAFLNTGGRGRDMQELVEKSLGAFYALFRALLFIHQNETPDRNEDVITQLAGHIPFRAEPFLNLTDVRKGRAKKSPMEMAELLKDYVAAVAELAGLIDCLNTDNLNNKGCGGESS